MIKHQRTSITIHNSTKIGSRTLQSPRTYGVECHELPTPSMMVTTNEHVFGANEAHAKADFCSGKWCLLPLSTSTHLRGIVIRISTSLSLARSSRTSCGHTSKSDIYGCYQLCDSSLSGAGAADN